VGGLGRWGGVVGDVMGVSQCAGGVFLVFSAINRISRLF
jgi:hypothetical protein